MLGEILSGVVVAAIVAAATFAIGKVPKPTKRGNTVSEAWDFLSRVTKFADRDSTLLVGSLKNSAVESVIRAEALRKSLIPTGKGIVAVSGYAAVSLLLSAGLVAGLLHDSAEKIMNSGLKFTTPGQIVLTLFFIVGTGFLMFRLRQQVITNVWITECIDVAIRNHDPRAVTDPSRLAREAKQKFGKAEGKRWSKHKRKQEKLRSQERETAVAARETAVAARETAVAAREAARIDQGVIATTHESEVEQQNRSSNGE